MCGASGGGRVHLAIAAVVVAAGILTGRAYPQPAFRNRQNSPHHSGFLSALRCLGALRS
ncbi:hypothetical protein SBA4_880026 [Candidatus Sulfopaludibacter sp. SbA4]|nr:hypothetical protein SBA4_880026 [Candidatus Sulfopaludibacter sp. SbA4]